MDAVDHSGDVLFIVKIGKLKIKCFGKAHDFQGVQKVVDVVGMAELQLGALEYGQLLKKRRLRGHLL